MKDTYYFPHDYHARHDPKSQALIRQYGMVGYGLWWFLVEILYEQKDGKLEKFPKLYEALAYETKQNEATLQGFVGSLINDFNLLNEDETHIWSDAVIQRLQEREAKRLKQVISGRCGGIRSGEVRKNEAKRSEPSTNEAKERKGKEKKRKEISIEEPTTEICGLLFKNRFLENIKKIYGEALNVDSEIKACILWHTNKGNQIKSWDKAITNWLRIGYEKLGVVGGKPKQGETQWNKL